MDRYDPYTDKFIRDTIDRQAAINVVKGIDRSFVKYIEELPPAQPEIIRCKDCKHHWTHKFEVCELGQTFYDAEVDYCSLAERRTE